MYRSLFILVEATSKHVDAGTLAAKTGHTDCQNRTLDRNLSRTVEPDSRGSCVLGAWMVGPVGA